MKTLSITSAKLLLAFAILFSATSKLKSQALNFDGSDDYVQIPSFTFGSSWTAEAWIRPTNLFGNWNTVLGQSYYNNLSGFVIAVQSGSVFVDSPQGTDISTGISNGVWTHVAVTYSNNIMAFYKNGLFVGTRTFTFTNSTNPFYLGIRTNNTNSGLIDPYQGDIDEVRIWSTARTECEIQRYMGCEITTTATALVANYHFNQGLANLSNIFITTLTDAAGSNTGSLNGGVGYSLLGGSTSNWVTPASAADGISTPASASNAEIDVKGNGNSITDGSTSSSTTNHTDFNSVATRTFSIYNTGTTTLNVGKPVFTGPGASQFSITVPPASFLATGTGSTYFVVAFTPTSSGAKSATLNIFNSECSSEEIYDFVITATAVPAAALNFDYVSDVVNTKDPIIGLSDFTIEGWIKPTTSSGFIVSSRFNEGFGAGYWYTIGHSSGTIGMEMAECGNGGSNYVSSFVSSTAIPVGSWGHYAITRSGSNYVMYINGNVTATFTESASHNFNNTAVNTSSILNVGGWAQNNSSWFGGSMDELRIWKTARTQCEIQSFMNCEIPGTATNLVSNYHFNQGFLDAVNTQTVINDASANTYTGSLISFALTGTTSNWVAPGGVTSSNTASVATLIDIGVKGNNTLISYGDVTPSTSDFTDFNGVMTRTFVIENTVAGGTLLIGTPYLSGPNASHFIISTLPSASINGIGSTSFVVSFVPGSGGTKSATINIPSNDCSETIYNFAITATATSGAAMNFDGVDDRIIVPSGFPINNTSFSVEFLARRTNTASNGYVCGQGNSLNPNESLHIGFRAGNVFTFAFYFNDINVTNPAATDGNYHHWACVYDAAATGGKNRFIYLDGVLIASDYTVALSAPGDFIIGDGALYPLGYPNPFGGDVDELRVWSTARSQCEIQTYMNSQLTSTATGLLANYHFDQGTAGGSNATTTLVIDATGNSYNGITTAFSLSGTSSNWVAPGAIAIGYTTATAPSATLQLSGNSNPINHGSTTSSTLNFTDFGTVSTRTLVLQNTGSGPLYINTGYITGANASNFMVTTTPSSVIVGGGSSSVVVNFTPSTISSHSAILNIVTSDCSHPTYSFVISATPTLAASLDFDGYDDVVTIPNSSQLMLSNAMALEAWVKPRDNNGIYYVVAKGANDITGGQYGMVIIGGQTQFHLYDATGHKAVLDPDPLPLGVWSHLAGSWDGKTMSLYINGILKGTFDYSLSLSPNSDPLQIGRSAPYDYQFNGVIDEVRIWNTPRTQCEIQSYMNCEITNTLSALVANYHFNQGLPFLSNSTTTLLTDGSGNAHNGTLSGFSLNFYTSNWLSQGGVVSGYTTAAISTASIQVSGNANTIVNGSAATSTLNFTDFAGVTTRSFNIQNTTGTGTLYLNNITFSGAAAGDFTATTQPSGSITTGSSNFVITFTPTALGIRTAVVHVSSSDCTIPNYSFVITASVAPAEALAFDGGNQVVATDPSFGTNDFTIETWVKMNTIGHTYLLSTRINEGGAYGNYWDFGVGANGNAFFETADDGTVNYFGVNSPNGAVSPNVWTHIAATRSGSHTSVYVNGILEASYTAQGITNLYSSDGTMRFSGSGAGLAMFDGVMDEVRIWNYARTQCQILSNMNAEIPSTATGLLRNYHFNQGIPSGMNLGVTTLTDAASVSTGTLNSFQLSGSTSNWVSPGAVAPGYTTVVIPTGTLTLSGNGNNIPIGSTTGTNNFTDFGTASSHTYSIQNPGVGPLYIGNAIFSGANASNFSLTVSPSTLVAGSGTSSFEISLIPTTIGTYSAIMTLVSSDCAHPEYTFVITATAQPGAAVVFDGIDDYIDLGNSSLLKPTGALTAETWAYMSGWSAADRTLMGNTENAGYGIFTTATGELQGLVRRNSTWGTVNAPLAGLSAGWHHVALTYDGKLTKLYVDGTLAATDDAGATYTVDYVNNNTLLAAEASSGMYPIAGWFFNGKLDETRIWNRALCAAEIQNNMHCEIATSGSGLVANYHFNQGVASGFNSTVSTLPDFSSNNLDGSLMDMQKQGAMSNWVSPGAVTSGSSCSVFVTPEIDITANGNQVPLGSQVPTSSNNTDFGSLCSGSVSVKSFTIQNSGTAPLTVSSISLTGSGAASFSAVTISPASPVPTNTFAVLSVSFIPSSSGVKSATLTIINSDCDESTYSFVITGTANPIPTVTASITNSVVCEGTAVTLNGSGADTYTWSPLVSNGTSFIPATSQVYTLSGTYTLTGCTNTNLATQSLVVNPIPTVAITVPSATICSGTNATLIASGAGTGATYTWMPGSSNATTLILSPANNTTYTLAGTSTAGCTSTNSATQLITVNTTPTLTATSVNTAVCNTFSATLSVSGATTYSWMPGSLSGGTVTVAPSSTTTYTAVGYGSTGCISSNSISITVTVNSLPVVTATASSPVICNTASTSLIGGGASTYTWSPAAVNGQAFTPPAGVTAYTVTGTNALTGCTSTNLAVQSVTVDLVPTVSVSATNSVICIGTTATLTASGAVNYTWNPGGFSGAVFNPTPTAFTNYTVVGTSSAGCTSTNLAVQSISVNGLPTVSASISNSVICAGASVTVSGSGASTYTWNNGAVDGVAFSPASTGSYSVAGTNSAGCTSTNVAIVSVTVNTLPTLSVSVTNSVICLGNQSTLNGSGALTYTWSNGITNGTAFSPTTTSQYTLTATDSNGCAGEALSTITVNALPLLTIASTSSISCEAQSATLTVNGAASYTWNTSETSASIIITPTATTVYSLTAMDANSCTNTASYTQSVIICPGTFSATVLKTDISCSGKDNGAVVVTAVSSYSNPVYSYQWNASALCPSNSCDTLKNLPAGTYYLTVKVTYTVNGSLVKTDSIVMSPIVLRDLNGPCDVKVFTGFSPNGDGINDVMAIQNIEEYPKNTVTVYNRWGVEVFKIQGYNNLDKAFPIKDEVKNLPSNTYFYMIDLGDGSNVIKGWIELIK